ncbi:LysR family transcriptional regulator [Paraburkholderia silvatlantica]|uniref:DNA-binding transcriptional LysR family regulator n=1 Tax=Paraburkholderia silvatlantica TaxID=321895 RepID=A0A2U0ZWK3_9BURK|nr:LysR family transcriptional regulator [Paraburkholderia silvatlantica]MBB2926137.1 DNA-binding transcriptional LysR family regulator [Paraburkholderia silvatlantica]PVY23400.1 DNA-binding transcriptional LysR family regulator [Paraburkholderia silvatlantica]PXW30439.1 DNA-binding transcriptional LysR family regulator [Paraburkholderia silvatlantica]PYE17712.1 DNA-binding transcriptional LysR family regulator [Paraburkholderia silvatlantica]TDQ98412.1 DNA-binding transcriptional LysR family 
MRGKADREGAARGAIEDIGERPLRYLAEIAAAGGVRMAAEALGINASVISRQVAALERRLRFPLIERRGRNVALTEIGQVLVDHYRDGQRRQRDLAARLEEYRHLRRGRVALGVGEGFIGNLIARALQRFSMTYPDILVEIRSGPTPVVLSLVRDDVVDIGLCTRTADDPAMRIHPFASRPLCALVAPSHRFAKMPKVAPAELAGERLIFMTESFGVQHFVQSLFDDARLNVMPAYRVDLFNTAQTLAAAGLGVAFMSSITARRGIDLGELVAVPIDHPIAAGFSSQMVTRVGRRLSPAADHLRKQLAQSFLESAAK